jgi:hypothetical protein
MPAVSCASVLRVLAAALMLVPVLPVASAGAVPTASGRRSLLVLDDEFRSRSWGSPGALWSDRTTAYPDGITDAGDSKFDRVRPSALTLSHGTVVVTATARSPRGPWQTGLLTTEPWNGGEFGGNGFQLRTGDYAVVRMKLPSRTAGGGHGAWPGLWTWRDGNEVDLLEWHSETPGIAEVANHAQPKGGYSFVHTPLVGFGKWVTVGVRFGANDVSWYLGDDRTGLRLAYEDHVGVGPSWHAYLIANLSVSAQRGRVPTSTRPITMAIDRIQVYR